MRTCPKCKICKEDSDFWRTCSYCKSCQKEHWRNRINKNKRAYAENRKDIRFKNNARPCKKCGDLFIGKKRSYCCTKCNFSDQVLKSQNKCWEWNGLKNKSGYGYLTEYETSKRIFAHRYSYRIFKGIIPDNIHVLHRCDNPGCCSPFHLFLGTDKDNMSDCKKKGRTAKGDKVAHKGEKNPNSIFTEELVFHIRKLCEQGFKDREISNQIGADKYSVYQINAIRHRRSWKHID